MTGKNETLKLIHMNEVEATEISWLWYPYIPYGKITVIQGDPGDGKTTVGRIKGKPYTRAIVQGKNNLAPEGQAIGFELDPATGFRWLGVLPVTIDELLSGVMQERDTTYDRAVDFLKRSLADVEKPAAFLFEKAASEGIQERTLRSAKQALAVPSYRRDKKWFWGALPQAEENENE